MALVAACLGLMGLSPTSAAVVADASPTRFEPALGPANPNASAEARALLHSLAGLPERGDQRVISGQHLSYHIRQTAKGYQEYITDLHASSGEWVAMVGTTYGLGATLSEIRQANPILIDHWNHGGLIIIDHHANNPWTGGSPWDLTSRDLVELITPGTAANQVWMAELDKVAAGMAELRDAGVVVLWRPFHEMSFLECFWWDMGAVLKDHPEQGAEAWKDMWKHMFHYFTYEKGLDNLLWVFSPADTSPIWNPIDLVYPGDEYVDIVALDVYSDTTTMRQENYDKLAATGKPFGLGEVGPGYVMDGSFDNLTIIDAIRNRYPRITFFQNWHSWTDHKVAIIDNRHAADLLNDPWVITRDEVDWRQAGTTFADVPLDHPYHDEIEALYRAGYTAGCSTEPLKYCPEETMTRAESAVFVEHGIHSADLQPGQPGSQRFADLPLESWAAKWADALYVDGYTAGCGTNPLRYCPWQGHTRAEGAVFYLRMLHGIGYEPPPAQGLFADVPLESWGARWAEAAYGAGLIPSCGDASQSLRFCPDDPLTRGLAAYMMVQAKGLALP